jgi:hypothetical protein
LSEAIDVAHSNWFCFQNNPPIGLTPTIRPSVVANIPQPSCFMNCFNSSKFI